MLSPEKITVELTNQQSLVLFEFLRRCDDEGKYSFLDQAEERVLWTIEGILEKQLVEIFSPDYTVFLKEARDQLRDPVLAEAESPAVEAYPLHRKSNPMEPS